MPKAERLQTSINYLQSMICKFINKFIKVNNVSVMSSNDLIIAAYKQQQKQQQLSADLERLQIGHGWRPEVKNGYLEPPHPMTNSHEELRVTEGKVEIDYSRQEEDNEECYSGVVKHRFTGESEYHAADWLDLYKVYQPMSKHFISRSTDNMCGIITNEAEKALRRWYSHARTARSIVVWGDVNHPDW